MTEDPVRICPSCGNANPAAALRCACGTLLTGIDPVDRSAAAPGASVPANDATGPAASAKGQVCSFADCGQPLPPAARTCVYCGRAVAGAAGLALLWPWGERAALNDELQIGRRAPTPAALCERFEREFNNLSRAHARLYVRDGAVWLEDLGSRNGSFVNGTRLPPHQPVKLHVGAQLRFAADLTAQLVAETA